MFLGTLAATPRYGDLVGARLTTHRPAAVQATAGPTENDPVQQHLLPITIGLGQARAEQLPETCERFVLATRAEGCQWNAALWSTAGPPQPALKSACAPGPFGANSAPCVAPAA
ncbi:hypothetical protein [Hymenobacter glaciei]|uniref:hypothetical protein n=1 Tax=Hymenobacter glaciei TaxID=877209 RepID=UPI0031ED708B